jgi:hypothetical protein
LKSHERQKTKKVTTKLLNNFQITIFSFSFIAHCKKELAVFPSPAGMSLIKLFLGGKNLLFSRPERVWSVTSRLGTGKWLTPFYSALLPAKAYEEHNMSIKE